MNRFADLERKQPCPVDPAMEIYCSIANEMTGDRMAQQLDERIMQATSWDRHKILLDNHEQIYSLCNTFDSYPAFLYFPENPSWPQP